ncbi:virulence factor [Roseivivax sediminis]|uniref:Virulence factor n=1 Tax=Roseivivax sediminis TaxID=936889 RepID=A0A1I1WZ81_9RHOB|nr:virulence factor [Roseivivax sediminis]SFE00446.1 Virulence factor [Roseivivax sediminis]
MAALTIVYWRDIPAQVIVGGGRRGAKMPLPERFEQAIDRAAMASGAAGTDAYLAGWHKVPAGEASGDAAAEAARIDAEYDHQRLISLAHNGGHAHAHATL